MKNTLCSALLALTVALTFCNCEYDHDLLGNWKSRGECRGKARGGATCFVIDGKAYIVGGIGYYKIEEYYLDTWQFDPEGRSWTQYDTVPASKGRSYGMGFAVNGKGYYGTGIGKEGIYYNDFFEFDPSKEAGSQWTVTDTFPGAPVYGGVGFSIDGIGYAGLGQTKALGPSNTIYAFNPENEAGKKWSIVPNINPAKRVNGSIFIIDDRAYFFGGVSNSMYVYDFERFDPSIEKGDNRWFKISQDFKEDYRKDNLTKLYRQKAAAFAINGRGYICGGSGSAGIGAMSDVWEYIPFGGRDNLGYWTEVASFEGYTRYGACSFAIDGVGYVICGQNGSGLTGYYDDVWEFCPQEDYDEKQYK